MKFSVIIPTYQRPVALQRCLQSFLKLDYSDWEIIVVNDGGDFQLDESLAAQLPLTVIHAEHNGPATARNRGAEVATGDIFAFTDDDCLVTADWLTQFQNCFENKLVDALGGEWLNPLSKNAAASTWILHMRFLREVLLDTAGNSLLLVSNNVAYRREVFIALGGFDETFPLAAAEDFDLSQRLIAAGYQQDFCPEAKVWHAHDGHMIGFLRQQIRYGRGSTYFQPKVEGIARKRGEFHLLLVRYLWEKRAPLASWFLLGLTPFAHKFGKISENYRRNHHQRESS